MDIAIKISALEEFAQRQNSPQSADEAAHALGMVAGLKKSLRPDFDYDEALIEASYELQNLIHTGADPLAIERAVGFFSGIVFSETNDVFEAQASGFQEKEALKKMIENGQI